MHRARSIEHTRSVRVCWPRMHGACTPQPMTLPGACMHGLRQWSANGPQKTRMSHFWDTHHTNNNVKNTPM